MPTTWSGTTSEQLNYFIANRFRQPIGPMETLFANERIVTIKQTPHTTTAITRDRANGQVNTETFYGSLQFLRKD